MTALPRNVLLGSLVMLSAIGVASCTSGDSGKTLSVTAVYNSPQYVLGGAAIDANPVIVYLGAKTLAYAWTVDLPPGGEVSIDGINTRDAKFTFNQTGDYNVKLLVYETSGTISEKSNGIYRVAGFAELSATVVAPAITGTPNASTGLITGSSPIVVSVSGGRAPYSYSWSTPSLGTLSSTTSANPTLTVVNAPAGSTITMTCVVTDSEATPQVQVFTVNIPVAATTSG